MEVGKNAHGGSQLKGKTTMTKTPMFTAVQKSESTLLEEVEEKRLRISKT